MLEPEPSFTTSEREEEVEGLLESNNVQSVIIAERSKAMHALETDMVHLSSAQKMLLKITQEQSEKIDEIEDNLNATSDLMSIANESLIESEKLAAQRRKRNIVVSVFGGMIVTVVAAVTTVSVLAKTNRL